jgi:hypothetical protein
VLSRRDGPGPTATEVDAWFDEFWRAYPRRVNKLAARRAYRAIVAGTHREPDGRATAPQLLAALKAHRFPTDPQYVPHAATWLNKGAWCEAAANAADPIGAEIEEMLAKPTWKHLVRERGEAGARQYVRQILETARRQQHATAA